MPRTRRSARRRHTPAQVGGGIASFTGDILNDLLQVVVKAIGTLSSLAEVGVDTLGTSARQMGDDVLKVRTTQLFRGVGTTAKNIGEGLGKVVDTVPLMGKPAAYIVENAGKGVHYVVVSVGDLLGEVASRVGRAAGDASNLVVFTLASAHVSLDGISESVQKKVHDLTREDAK